jgi:acetyl esterase/lipase
MDNRIEMPQIPVDPEMRDALVEIAPTDRPAMTRADIPSAREMMKAQMGPGFAEAIKGKEIDLVDRQIPGPEGAPDLMVSILTPRGLNAPAPALYNIHGGGMMVGHRQLDAGRIVGMVETLGMVAVSVEYRLAPEHPDPAPVEDCHAGLVWLAANARVLGVDPDKIIVTGGSAGGGLSAGVALIARDRGTVEIAGQMLLCPMIDDTNSTPSSHQFLTGTTWPRSSNLLGWECLLGERVGTDDVSPYAAPTRASDLSGLPPAFIEVGSAEMFRDEDIDFARRIWAVGGEAELHVWQGGFHGFDVFAPDTELARAATRSRYSWLRRVLDLPHE